MTDLHSHLLYGLDDGASDRETCCRMLELYAAGKVRSVICSSHSGSDTGNRYDECFARCAELAETFGIKLVPALEYSLPDILSSQRRTLGDGQYLLLDPGMFPVDSAMLTRLMTINAAGYRFLWAHPERLYPRHSIRTVEKLAVLTGTACQINAGSLIGVYGTEVKESAWELLQNNHCAVIASDAHDTNGVKNLITVKKLLSELYPEEFIKLWFETNPARILAGKIPERRMPPPLDIIRQIKRFFATR